MKFDGNDLLYNTIAGNKQASENTSCAVSKRDCVNDHIPLFKVFGFLAVNYQHELPMTGLSGAGGG